MSAEPDGRATRLTGEMQGPDTNHHAHDELLVAGLLDRSTDGPERDRGEALVAACTDCAALHRDLLALREATRALPTRHRSRDYSISSADARRLRRTGWRGLIAVFGSARDAFSKPLAIGLTTIGLAGLLLGAVPGALPGAASRAALPSVGQPVGGAGSGTTSEAIGEAKEAPLITAAPSAVEPAAIAAPAPSSAPSQGPALAAPPAEPSSSSEAFDTFAGGPGSSIGAAEVAPAPNTSNQRLGGEGDTATSVGQGTSSVDRGTVLVLAGLLLVAGLGLFALRWAGRRV